MLLEVPESNASKQVRDFTNHFVESAILGPLKAGYQLAQKSTGDLLPELEIKKPESKTAGAVLGDLLGTGTVFAGSWLLTRGVLGKAGLNPNLPSSLMGKSFVSGIEMGTAGAIVGALHPIDSSKDFWSGKRDHVGYMAATSALYGATWKGMSSSGGFGAEGERTLKQAIALNTTAGGGVGFADAFLRSGIIEKRLPTATEVAKSTALFAAMGAGLGVMEVALPKVMGSIFDSTKQAPLEKQMRTNLSMSAVPEAPPTDAWSKRFAEIPKLEASVNSKFLELPLPSFNGLGSKVPLDKPISSSALAQSTTYTEAGIITGKLEDGVRIATSTQSHGLTSQGIPLHQFEKFVVMDKAADPALRAVLDDASRRFGSMERNGELAKSITNYVSSLMNRHNLPPATLEQVYIDTLRRSGDGLIPLGTFLCRGTGVCLPRAALVKSIGDEIGMSVRLREGFIGIKKPQAHVWPEFDLGNGYRIYDPMHPPNPLYKYTSSKH